MRKYLLLLLFVPVIAFAANWHNKTDGSYCLELSVSDGDIFCLDSDSFDFTFAAGDKLLLDADTTNHTQTAGVLDINLGTVTADVNALNIAITQDNGTSSGVNSYAGKILMTQNDADADMDGLLITAAATANAGAGSYEYAIAYDCAENTAGACLDGILITSSGTATGMTDGLDVSDSAIVNAVNIGVNPILGGNSDTFDMTTDATFTITRNDSGTVTVTGADDAGAANTTYDTTGAGAIAVGSADVTAITLTTDGTGTGEVVLPAGSVSGTEVTDATLLPADDLYPGRGYFEICGDIATVNNNTVYYGPSQAVIDSATAGMVTCNTDAAGSTTESTADEPVLTADAILPLGMVCYSTDMGATGSPLTFTLRSAAADITPSITLQIADNELSSAVNTAATTAIASGATVAVALSSSGDVGAGAFICRVHYAF